MCFYVNTRKSLTFFWEKTKEGICVCYFSLFLFLYFPICLLYYVFSFFFFFFLYERSLFLYTYFSFTFGLIGFFLFFFFLRYVFPWFFGSGLLFYIIMPMSSISLNIHTLYILFLWKWNGGWLGWEFSNTIIFLFSFLYTQLRRRPLIVLVGTSFCYFNTKCIVYVGLFYLPHISAPCDSTQRWCCSEIRKI